MNQPDGRHNDGWHKVNFDSGRPLRIALLAGLMLPVPPVAYGGTERVAAALANKLMKRGHDVTMFASGD